MGSRTSLLGPLLAVLLEVVIGVPIALAAAWNGGVVDGVISRVLDVLFAFPGILLAILIISLFGAGLKSAVVALAVAHLPYLARITRGAAIRERRLPYVEALELQGFSGIPHLRPAPHAESTASDRRPGERVVRLRHDRPRGALVPRARSAAAHSRLGSHDLGR